MEVAGLILGVIPIAAALFQSTLNLYSIYSESQDTGKTSIDHQILIRVEKCRYENWGEYAGLNKGTLISELQGSSGTKIDLILDLLAHIAQAFLESGELEKKYHSGKTGSPSLAGTLIQSTLAQPPGLQPVPPHTLDLASDINARRTRYAELAQEVRLRMKLASSLKLAVWGKGKFDALIKRLRELNDGLDNITSKHQNRLQMKVLLQMTDPKSAQSLLVLSNATVTAYPTISGMAKRKAMYLDLQERQIQQRNSRRLNPNAIDPELRLNDSEVVSQGRGYSGREFGTYKGDAVMIEWKIFSDDMSEDESLCRIRDLAKFLSKDNSSKSGSEGLPNLLECIGYFSKCGKTDRAALVYKTTDTTNQSLKGLLESSEQANFNLGARFRFALSLAECIFFLHITGWLHKNLNSENIIVSGDAKGHSGTRALQPYLAGFNAARLDGTAEISEKFEIGSRSDLYQHPDYQDSNRDAVRYSRQYDIYSLGLVLLELGSWETIEVSGGFKPKSKHNPTKYLSKLLKGPVDSLSFTMGNAYRRAVVWCLKGQFEKNGQQDYASLEDREKSMVFWDNVVLELAKCSVEE